MNVQKEESSFRLMAQHWEAGRFRVSVTLDLPQIDNSCSQRPTEKYPKQE